MRRLIAVACACIVTCIVLGMNAHAADSTSTRGELTKSPTTAVLYSLAFPGLGQYYVESYWKIPIFTGAAITTAVLFFSNNADFNTAASAVDAAVASGADNLSVDRLRRQREAYRTNRDLAGAFFLVTYGLAALDAYVGAHLHDFDVDENLSVGMGPTRTQYLALSLRIAM